jgi:hypothetical protein
MIKEAVFLFILIGNDPTNLEEQYIGKLNQCSDVIYILDTLKKRLPNVEGYVCYDKKDARKKFQHRPTPQDKLSIKRVQEHLIPPAFAKPFLLQKK